MSAHTTLLPCSIHNAFVFVFQMPAGLICKIMKQTEASQAHVDLMLQAAHQLLPPCHLAAPRGAHSSSQCAAFTVHQELACSWEGGGEIKVGFHFKQAGWMYNSFPTSSRFDPASPLSVKFWQETGTKHQLNKDKLCFFCQAKRKKKGGGGME